MSRPIRLKGEKTESAINRGIKESIKKGVQESIGKELLAARKELNALKNKKISEAKKLAKLEARKEAPTFCRECKETKPKYSFKVLEVRPGGSNHVLVGVCNGCSSEASKTNRKAQETAAATKKANSIMTEAISDIERIFKRHKIPLENQLIKDILKGCMKVLSEIQATALSLTNTKGFVQVSDIGIQLEKAVIYPTVLYTYTVSNYNQVKTAEILGISRNNLRTRMKEIEENCPRLIEEYRCQDKWPQLKHNNQTPQTIGDLEMDPDMEVTHEETFNGMRRIDSNIGGHDDSQRSTR